MGKAAWDLTHRLCAMIREEVEQLTTQAAADAAAAQQRETDMKQKVDDLSDTAALAQKNLSLQEEVEALKLKVRFYFCHQR